MKDTCLQHFSQCPDVPNVTSMSLHAPWVPVTYCSGSGRNADEKPYVATTLLIIPIHENSNSPLCFYFL